MFRNSYLTFYNESLNTDKSPSVNNNNAPGSANEREKLGRGGPRPYVRNSGVCHPFGFNIPLNKLVFTIFLNRSDPIWLPSEYYLWALYADKCAAIR